MSVTTMNVHEAKTNLSELLARVERGEEVVIARAGTPVARLVPVAPPQPRRFGGWTGWVSDDFDEPLSEQELAEWE